MKASYKDKVIGIFEERLKLQSTQRYLDIYKFPYKIDFYFSPTFKEEYFDKWTLGHRRKFLIKMVGNNWKQLNNILEKGN